MLAPYATTKEDHLELTFAGGGQSYCIEYHRMDTTEKAFDWVRQLAGKSKIQREHIEVFVDVAQQLGVRTVDA